MFDIQTATMIIVASMLALMVTGMPLGIVTLTVSIGTALAFFGTPGLFLVASNATGLLESYPLVAVPLFVFMANILERSGVAEDLFDAMSLLAGNLRGGVAVQTTLVAVVMAAMTGIMGGEIVMLGLIALPQMLRLRYDKKLAMGTICAGGSLATLIPPSTILKPCTASSMRLTLRLSGRGGSGASRLIFGTARFGQKPGPPMPTGASG